MSSLIRELFCNQCQVAVNSPGITVELAVYLTDPDLPRCTIHVQVSDRCECNCIISCLRYISIDGISNATIIGKPSSVSIL